MFAETPKSFHFVFILQLLSVSKFDVHAEFQSYKKDNTYKLKLPAYLTLFPKIIVTYSITKIL